MANPVFPKERLILLNSVLLPEGLCGEPQVVYTMSMKVEISLGP